MEYKDKFCKLIDAELDKIAAQPQLTDVGLNNLHKLTDTKKNLLKIEKLEMELDSNEEMYQGMSRDNSYNSYRNINRNSMRGNSNRYMPSHPPIYGTGYDNNSYGWDVNGYSMDGGDSYSYLEEAMRHATSDAERESIRQLMSKLYK